MDYSDFSYLDAQQSIGKVIVENIVGIAQADGQLVGVTEVEFGDDAFEITVVMKNGNEFKR